MESKELVVINGQLCSKDIAMMLIEKVLPTVLDVVAEKVKCGRSEVEVKNAAETVVNAAVSAISLKSLIAPKA